MNIWLIFVTEMKHVIRNRTSLVMMVLFPLILMLILGSSLGGAFHSPDAVADIRISYLQSELSPLSLAFRYFATESGCSGIRFQEVRRLSQGMARIRERKDDCLVQLTPGGMTVYQNDHSVFRASLARAVLNAFLQRYKVIATLVKIKPQDAVAAGRRGLRSNLTTETSLNGGRKPRAMDYYAVTMLTLIIMYSTLTGSYAIKREILDKTANRLLCCPVRNHEILIGKICGAFCSALLHVGIVVAVSKYLFRAYWGDQPAVVALLLIAEVLMATSVGIGLAFLIHNQIALNGFLNLIIPVVVFLGGGYIPVDSFGKLFLRCAALSPVRWINQAILGVIYQHDFGRVLPAVLINLGIAAVFVGVASMAAREEAFLK